MAILAVVIALHVVPLLILLWLMRAIRRTFSRPFKSATRRRVAVIVGNVAIAADVLALLAAVYMTVQFFTAGTGGISGLMLLITPAILIAATVWTAIAYLICVLQAAPRERT